MKYQNKQTNATVEAQALTEDNGWDLEEWCGGRFSAFSGVYYFDLGTSRAELGDYIVKSQDSFSIIEKDLFEKTYIGIT